MQTTLSLLPLKWKRKINQLTREQADEIMNPHKEENQSREQATFDLLNQYLG